MKKILFFITLCSLFSIKSYSQSEGTITYAETMKLDIQVDGLDEEMMAMLPKSQSFERQLVFSGKETLFKDVENKGPEQTEMSSDDGSFQLKIVVGDQVPNILYRDYGSNEQLHQMGIMGKAFLVNDKIEKLNWKLTNEKIKYLGYECQKAVIEEDEDIIVAWYTSAIPITYGPSKYHGLPGAILMLSINEDELEYRAKEVSIASIEEEIKKPKKGKKVTKEEFEKIRTEKESEMKEVYKSTEFKSVGH